MKAIWLVAGMAACGTVALAQEKAPAVVSGDKLEQTSRCDKDQTMRVLANNSHLSILGNCAVVRIEGSRNWILVEHARRIVATGNQNTVMKDDDTTQVDDRGKGNSIADRWPQ